MKALCYCAIVAEFDDHAIFGYQHCHRVLGHHLPIKLNVNWTHDTAGELHATADVNAKASAKRSRLFTIHCSTNVEHR